jgi:hypothetical protein
VRYLVILGVAGLLLLLLDQIFELDAPLVSTAFDLVPFAALISLCSMLVGSMVPAWLLSPWPIVARVTAAILSVGVTLFTAVLLYPSLSEFFVGLSANFVFASTTLLGQTSTSRADSRR